MRSSGENNGITAAQIKLLQVARREVGLGEEEYRNVLGLYGGVESAKKLTQKGFEKVMKFLTVSCGFEVKRRPKEKRKYYSDDPVSPNQNRRIIELFKSLGWETPRQRGFCRKLFRNLWPMNRGDASRLIETLKEMEARGYRERGTPSGSDQ